MEKKHRCKLCFRSFANGRALGGHMRSHMMKFYAAQKLSEQEEEEENHSFDDFQSAHSYSSTSSSSSSEDEQEEEESPEVKAVASGSVVLQDRESETESFKRNPICRRSKRVRKSRISDFVDGFFGKKPKLENECCSSMAAAAAAENEPLSSVSDTASDEHVAHCLMMLSRDNWKREEEEEETELQFEIEDEKKFIDDADDSEDSGVGKVIKTSNNKVRGKYRCEACNKLFRSYQALGGHRASHKKIKVAAPPQKPNANSGGGSAAVVEEKIHQCPFCPRIFSSGQALGGHKRTHLLGGGAITAGRGGNIEPPAKERSRSGETLSIDLNLPAPIDDDEASQIAVSALSDAEFVHSIKQW